MHLVIQVTRASESSLGAGGAGGGGAGAGGGGGAGDGGRATTTTPASNPATSGDVAAIPEGNLTANPSFEDDITGWDTQTSELARIPAADAPDGSQVASVTLTGSATDYAIDDAPDTVASSKKRTTYTAAAWIKGTESTHGKPVCISVRERSADGETLDQRSAQVIADAARFKRVVVAYEAHNDGNRVDVHLFRQGDDLEQDDGFLVDAISLVEGTSDARSNFCEL